MNGNLALELLKDKLRRVGLKLTKQREVIAQVFFDQVGHLRAEDILQVARRVDARVSLATVYRTLKLLQEFGFAESHNFQDGQALFEPRFDIDEHHDHLICTVCGLIVEFVNEDIEALQMRVAEDFGFTISSHKMELYGTCSSCAKNIQS